MITGGDPSGDPSALTGSSRHVSRVEPVEEQALGGASDVTLLACAAAGDNAAMGQLIRRHGTGVFGLAQAITGDRLLAEDAVQETFLRVWRFADGFDARKGHVRTWVLAIARNVSVDIARVRGRHPILDLAEIEAMLGPDAAPGPEGRVIAEVSRNEVRSALDRIPEPQRRALILARWMGWTAAEIAESEGVPVGTAKSRLRLGLAALRVELQSRELT